MGRIGLSWIAGVAAAVLAGRGETLVRPAATGAPPGQTVDGATAETRPAQGSSGRPRRGGFVWNAVFRFAPQRFAADHPDVRITSVGVAGTFNGWDWNQCRMELTPDGDYRATIELLEGLYAYRLVINGEIWMEDPLADPRFREPNGQGGFNSGILVGEDARQFGPARPDAVNPAAVRHAPQVLADFNVIAPGRVELGLRTLADDVAQVLIEVAGRPAPVPCPKSNTAFGFDYWRTDVDFSGSALKYRFLLVDGAAKAYWPRAESGNEQEFEAFVMSTPVVTFATPDWAKSAVWYQIFPSRFRNGSVENDPANTIPWTHDWSRPCAWEKGDLSNYLWSRRFGGDLQGVRDRLGYLRELGVTAIYFNPLFQAATEHKYDACDLRHIDDSFGVKGSRDRLKGETDDPATWQWSESDKVFLDLLKEAHRQGFKVVIDGVFNHVGRDHYAFQDVLAKGRDSAYAGWFEITQWEPEIAWKAWDGPNGRLVEFKKDAQWGLAAPVRDHLYAVTRRWMDPNGDGDPSDGVDGWRLDAAEKVPEAFWIDWRKLVKRINPQALICGEIWPRAGAYLLGDQFDTVTDYPVAFRVKRFFVDRARAYRPSEFAASLGEVLSWYPTQVNQALWLLTDSHDTDRIASMMANPDWDYDGGRRPSQDGRIYCHARPTPEQYQRLRNIFLFQTSFVGAPMIYYGDETGMFGGDDPHCRKPMWWTDRMPYDQADDRPDRDLLEYCRRVFAIRHSLPCLSQGTYETLVADDSTGVFAFARKLGGRQSVVVFNNSGAGAACDVPVDSADGAEWVDLTDPSKAAVTPCPAQPDGRSRIRLVDRADPTVRAEQGRLKVKLGPYSGAVLVPTADLTRLGLTGGV